MKQWTEYGVIFLSYSLHFQSFDDTDTLRGVNIISPAIQFII